MNLSEHFTLDEFIRSDLAIRKGIVNDPSQAVIKNLKTTTAGMEAIRALLGKPISVNSGYRCYDLNKALGGAEKSAHMDGYACDFTCSSFGTPAEIAHKIQMSGIKLDQCIMEGTWVHVSFAPTLRQQFLQAKFIGGKAYYSPFN